ncbi:MAG: hypothetical protein AAFX50_19060, partial [Acidobacteriota bacterium]
SKMLAFLATVAFAVSLEFPPEPRDTALAGLELRALQIDRLEAMTASEELAHFLGPNRHVGAGGPRLRSLSSRLRRLMKDPAFSTYRAIDDVWLTCLGKEADRFRHLRAIIDVKLLIARSLHSRGEAPSRSAVAGAFESLRALRSDFSELAIVEGRRVVFAASGDRLPKSQERAFGRAAVRRLLEQRAADFDVVGERSPHHAHRELEAALTRGRTTFYFEGHGNKDRLDYRELHVKKLAQMLVEGGGAPDGPRILILAACKSHDFARSLYRELDRLDPGVAKPVLIVPEESGQDYLKDVFSSGLLRVDLGVGVVGGGRLGFAFSNPRNGLSVFVPDAANRATQIL